MAEIVIQLVNGELAGKTLQEINKALRDSHKELSKAKIGTEEWVKAHEKLENAKKLQGDLKTQIDGTSKASGLLKQQFGGILNQIPGFGALSGHLNAAKGGVGGLTSGFGLLRGAIIATGLGALVILITSLVSWFSKTEKGANMISGAFKGMGAVVDTLLGRLFNIRDTLKDLFSNPVKFFKDLGNDIKNAAVEGYEFVQLMDDIEDRQRDMEVTAKQNDILIDQLLLQAKNAGKTYEERLALLTKANDLTKKTYQDQLALSKEYLDAVEKEVAAEMKRQGVDDMTGEQADKIKDAKLAYLDLLGQEIATEEKIANRKEQILGKQEKADEKAADKKEKQNEKDAKDLEASLDKLEDLRVNSIKDAEQKEIAATNLKFDREKEALKLQGAEKIEAEKLIEDQRGIEVQAIKDKYADLAIKKKKEALDKEIAAMDKSYEEENLSLLEQLADGNLTRKEFDELNLNNQKDHINDMMELLEAAGMQDTAQYRQLREEKAKIQQEENEAELAEEANKQEKLKQLAQRAFTAAIALGSALIQSKIDANNREVAMLEERLQKTKDAYGEESQAYIAMQAQVERKKKEVFEKNKQLQIKQVKINLAAQLSQIALEAIKLGWPAGLIVGGILAGAAVLNANNNIKNIQSQKYALGGVLRGPSHARGGIPIEAEGDEIIMTKGVFRNPRLRSMASAINVAGGGRRFEAGGPVSPFSDRAPISRSGGSVDTMAFDNSEIINEFRAFREEISSWQRNIKVINVVTETDEGIKTVNRIKEDADV